MTHSRSTVRTRAVVFDLDDTLYPERAYVFSGFEAVATALETELGDPLSTVARMRDLFDTEHRPRVFDALLAELHGATALLGRMIETYRRHVPTISLYPDADALLTRLKEPHRLGLTCRLGLITDGRAAQQWTKIDALGLRPRLDEIVLTAELGPGLGKPHFAAFELMAQRLGMEHGCCIYVADNPAKDFIAPNALGWATVRIHRGDGIHQHEKPPTGGAAQQTIDTLDRLESTCRLTRRTP